MKIRKSSEHRPVFRPFGGFLSSILTWYPFGEIVEIWAVSVALPGGLPGMVPPSSSGGIAAGAFRVRLRFRICSRVGDRSMGVTLSNLCREEDPHGEGPAVRRSPLLPDGEKIPDNEKGCPQFGHPGCCFIGVVNMPSWLAFFRCPDIGQNRTGSKKGKNGLTATATPYLLATLANIG